jgi:hypothetical protein
MSALSLAKATASNARESILAYKRPTLDQKISAGSMFLTLVFFNISSRIGYHRCPPNVPDIVLMDAEL